MNNDKYVLINELTNEILKSSDSLGDLQIAATKLSIDKHKRKQLIIKESATDEVVQQYGLLLD